MCSGMQMTALVLLFAGFDTTKSSLIAILHKLIEYPEVRKKLRAEVLETIGALLELNGAWPR